MPKKSYRDYLVFFCLTVFIVAHFLLQDMPNTEFYLALMTLSLFCVMLIKQYHKDTELPFDFDENLTLEKWFWIGGGVLGIYFIGMFFAGLETPGQFDPTIFIPTFSFNINYFLLGSLPTYVNDMLFNITLVAPAEELCKLVSIIALHLFLSNYGWVSKELRLGIAVGLPVFIWATLHVYSNPAYIGNPIFVLSAFVSGILLVVVLWKTKSILAAILSHGLYNSIVIYLVSMGFLVVSTT